MCKSNMAVDKSEFSFNTAVRGFHIDCRVWLPHFSQPLGVEREHRDQSQSLSEYSDTGANDDKPIDEHLTTRVSSSLVLSPFLSDPFYSHQNKP